MNACKMMFLDIAVYWKYRDRFRLWCEVC